ncbi:DNA gyrase inhibitor YacG [Candidatus Nitrospira salsa]
MRCPTCHNPITWNGNPFRPFCSERCRFLDLNGWLTEQYRIPEEDSLIDESDLNNGKHSDS